jgi:hypothetical protein
LGKKEAAWTAGAIVEDVLIQQPVKFFHTDAEGIRCLLFGEFRDWV